MFTIQDMKDKYDNPFDLIMDMEKSILQGNDDFIKECYVRWLITKEYRNFNHVIDCNISQKTIDRFDCLFEQCLYEKNYDGIFDLIIGLNNECLKNYLQIK